MHEYFSTDQICLQCSLLANVAAVLRSWEALGLYKPVVLHCYFLHLFTAALVLAVLLTWYYTEKSVCFLQVILRASLCILLPIYFSFARKRSKRYNELA